MKENTAKNFVIQLGSLIALYVSVSALLVLIFGVINVRFPDEAAYYYANESVREGIRISIAMLLVFFPTYLILTRISNQTRRKEENGNYTILAKWLVYLSLLVGGGIILGDLVTIIMYLLEGEITTRFILKALAILCVMSVTFSYYLLDARGYFKKREKQSIYFGIGTLLLVIAALITGFLHIETPEEVRQIKLDEQQINDLQDMQWRIEEYYRVENTLPATTAELYGEMRVPQAPEAREKYTYKITAEDTYELCATFVFSSGGEYSDRSMTYPVGKENYSWDHNEGEKCFVRTVDMEI